MSGFKVALLLISAIGIVSGIRSSAEAMVADHNVATMNNHAPIVLVISGRDYSTGALYMAPLFESESPESGRSRAVGGRARSGFFGGASRA